MIGFKAGICLTTLLALAGCGGGDGASGRAQQPTADAGAKADSGAAPDSGKAALPDFSEFDAAVESFLTEQGLEGASAVIVEKHWGIIHERGYGAFDAKRLYLIASSSKVLSVGILMRLADQGLLDLDAPISDYLGAWGSYKTDLTVAQLVSNSSGLVSLTDNALYTPYLCQYLPGGSLSECAKLIYTADDAKDRKPPDTEFHYGGGPWQLAGGIAEVVSGKKWADLVHETYGTACDVPSLGYTNQFAQAFAGGGGDGGGSVGAALGYPQFFQADAANAPVTANPSIEGGAFIAARDYGKILQMHLLGGLCDGGRVLSEQAVQRMQEDRIGKVYGGATIDPTLAGYGLGWWVDREHPGVVADAGAYGAMPWIDGPREYAAFIALEANAGLGTQLRILTKPILDGLFDAASW